jgi:FdhD protein
VRRGSTVRRPVERVRVADGGAARRTREDLLATEEPLEIRVVRPEDAGAPDPHAAAHRVSVTMRTPGADFELAAGFLFSEGVVDGGERIAAIRYCTEGPQAYNVVTAFLAPGAAFDPADLQRNFYATSSCGVCGKASIEAVLGPACPRVDEGPRVDPAVLVRLPDLLRAAQAVFDRTGGLHAAAHFTPAGRLVRVREDVGRHNAMDKLVGAALLEGDVPLSDAVVLVSGRLSFELVQKATRAGVPLLAGVSAPSSLAVELAERAGMTLAGFVRGAGFNVYTGGERIALAAEPSGVQ